MINEYKKLNLLFCIIVNEMLSNFKPPSYNSIYIPNWI